MVKKKNGNQVEKYQIIERANLSIVTDHHARNLLGIYQRVLTFLVHSIL
jgi:hypothetical protein